jgi:bifunctional non-homologous end joining protein LigD
VAKPRNAPLRKASSSNRLGELTFPRFIEPCHPSERSRPPSGPGWLHEIKQDGYRAQLHIRDDKIVVYSRRGYDWTTQFRSIAEAASRLRVRHAVLDGEAIVQGRNGVADYHALRSELARKSSGRLSYYAFDLLYLDGRDLRSESYVNRKRHLRELLDDAPKTFVYADFIEADAEQVFAQACRMGLEGIVSKRRHAPYRSGRQEAWIKTKCRKSGTYPIIAFVEKLGAKPRRIASFYIGRREDGKLLYAGKVQGGYTHAEAVEIRERLDPLITGRSPLSRPINKPKATWIEPRIEAEVEFGSITQDGILRESVFKGLRDDLLPPQRPARSASRAVPRENILQLLPDAVVPSKEELATYWRKVAKRALVYLGRRPLKLVRHTRGLTFYHKGRLPPVPDAVHQLRIEKREGGEGIRLWVDDLAGLLGLVEIGVVEVHPWAATVGDIEHADHLIFDLDPGPGVTWAAVIEAAVGMRDLLRQEGLRSWPKVTGGKGLHLMAPLTDKLSHDAAHTYAKRLAQKLAATKPDQYLTVADPLKRGGRIFIDYLRNGRGTTAVGTYSPRARPGSPIAAPVTWRQIEDGIQPDAFTMAHPLWRSDPKR